MIIISHLCGLSGMAAGGNGAERRAGRGLVLDSLFLCLHAWALFTFPMRRNEQDDFWVQSFSMCHINTVLFKVCLNCDLVSKQRLNLKKVRLAHRPTRYFISMPTFPPFPPGLSLPCCNFWLPLGCSIDALWLNKANLL